MLGPGGCQRCRHKFFAAKSYLGSLGFWTFMEPPTCLKGRSYSRQRPGIEGIRTQQRGKLLTCASQTENIESQNLVLVARASGVERSTVLRLQPYEAYILCLQSTLPLHKGTWYSLPNPAQGYGGGCRLARLALKMLHSSKRCFSGSRQS